jgi:pimeloyl-ACP methyl ester carboxylesterase
MPHYIQFYDNFKENETRLNIKNAVHNLKIPYLVIHGSKDETVLIEEAKNLYSWNSDNQILIVENANHTFNSKHPWDESVLPNNLEKAVNATIEFIGPSNID